MGPRKLIVLIAASALIASGCIGDGEQSRTIEAEFSRAVQVFPGVKVKVLGVDVGQVTTVNAGTDSVVVTMRIDDEDVKLQADVNAVIVPMSLLGERYVQLTPPYESGTELDDGATIPMARTSVPAEGDELLRAMNEYLGELDADTVEGFITNAAGVLEGKGERLNRLIRHGTVVLKTLASRRDELAEMIVQFNSITQALATRQGALARVINSYNVVGNTIVDVRSDLEGTIEGLNLASAQLADLLLGHEGALGGDIKALTRTTRTLDRNIYRFARTGRWARRLFSAASRAVDYKRDWLRLGNQGEPLFEMLVLRIEDRLVGLCLRLGRDECQEESYWEQRFPELFCPDGGCATQKKVDRTRRSVEKAFKELPRELDKVLTRAARKKCSEVARPKLCRRLKREAKKALDDDAPKKLKDVIDEILDGAQLPGGERL
jgi:phospholipid/cholesterol/gamma-HCH transport system substrate-binding protein